MSREPPYLGFLKAPRRVPGPGRCVVFWCEILWRCQGCRPQTLGNSIIENASLPKLSWNEGLSVTISSVQEAGQHHRVPGIAVCLWTLIFEYRLDCVLPVCPWHCSRPATHPSTSALSRQSVDLGHKWLAIFFKRV